MLCIPHGKAPRGGRLSTGRGSQPRRGELDRVGCLGFTHRLSGAWQERKGITSGRSDAQGLTFSAVIPARVMQPGNLHAGIRCGVWLSAATGWRSGCATKVTFVASPVGRSSAFRTGSGDPWPDSCGGRGPGWLPAPPSTSRYVASQALVWLRRACFRTPRGRCGKGWSSSAARIRPVDVNREGAADAALCCSGTSLSRSCRCARRRSCNRSRRGRRWRRRSCWSSRNHRGRERAG